MSKSSNKEDIIMEQPKEENVNLKDINSFKSANNYNEFLSKNGINNCYEIKTMFHECMKQKKNLVFVITIIVCYFYVEC